MENIYRELHVANIYIQKKILVDPSYVENNAGILRDFTLIKELYWHFLYIYSNIH